jgi:hypothetical protein
MIDGLVRTTVETLFDAVFTKTGRGLWGLIGQRPHDIVSMFTGMLFWAAIAVFAYSMMHG